MKSPLLNTINSPQNLKQLSRNKLDDLVQEIRAQIIQVLSQVGGHLASNLGVVELTCALHYVFESPKDKILFDTSHQSYIHKLLTGRREQFPSIRQYKGLCGFTNPYESKHDHFHAGHAGTALSLALGLAKYRDLTKSDEAIIPVIGDAGFSCGLTLEALNNIPKDLKRFIVILNDNAMSISKNVGNISKILSRLLNNPLSNRIYQNVDALVSKIPSFGAMLSQQGHKLTESLKNLVSPAAFFEQYGLAYVGPVDGHDVNKLIDLLEAVKNISRPTILHILTKKGHGMQEALDNPTPYHGAKPFDIKTGKFLPTKTNTLTFPKIFGKHLLKMAEKDPSLVAVTPAMTAGSCLDAFIERFPDRCLDVGIAEGHCVTFSGALAYGNKTKVLASIYSTFLQRAFDNLFHDVCLQEKPVVFAIDRAGIAAGDGYTHHGIYDLSFLTAMPNMVICQPRNGQVLVELLESSFSWQRPTAIRYPNMPVSQENTQAIKKRIPGEAELLVKGQDLLIIALGHMCDCALEVHESLKQEGIQSSVLDPVFIKPLDTQTLCELLHTHDKILTIEEHSLKGGLATAINDFIVQCDYRDVKCLNFGIPDTYVSQGSYKRLMDDLGLSSEKILQKTLQHFFLQTCAL